VAEASGGSNNDEKPDETIGQLKHRTRRASDDNDVNVNVINDAWNTAAERQCKLRDTVY